MAIRTSFATLSAATAQPLSLFDQQFADFANWVVLPCNAAGTNVLTLTPQQYVPQLQSYANYNLFSFVATSTSTGLLFATFQPLGTLPVYYSNGTTQVGAGAIVTGQPYFLQYNPTLNLGAGGFYLLSPAVPSVASVVSATAMVNGSSVIVNSATQLAINANLAVLPNSSYSMSILRTGITQLNNTATLGAGGLDTGTITSNSWYNIYLIDNGTAPSSLISLSSYNPVLPPGYIYYVRVGALYFGTSAWLLQQLAGAYGQWTVQTALVTGAAGSPTVPTYVPLQVRNGGVQAVPPTASRMLGYLATQGNSNAIVAPGPNFGATDSMIGADLVHAAVSASISFDFMLLSDNIYWAAGGSFGASVLALGWRDTVPCF